MPNKRLQLDSARAVHLCAARKLGAPRGVKQLAAESAAMKVLPVTSFIES